MRRLILFAALSTALVRVPIQAEDDPFDLLDQVAAPKTDRSPVLAQLRDRAEFELTARPFLYYQDPRERPNGDRQALGADGRFTAETQVVLGRHQIGLSGWLAWGSQKDTYTQRGYRLGLEPAAPHHERQRRLVELDALFWVSSWGKMDLTLGKRRVEVGMTPVYSPVMRFNPADFNDPLAVKEYGLWQIWADYYLARSRFSVAVLPFFSPPKIPSLRSRWLVPVKTDDPDGALLGDFQFFNQVIASGAVLGEELPHGADEVQLLVRAKTTLGGWDLAVSGFTGPTQYPVLLSRNDPATGQLALFRRYVRSSNLGAGFSTAMGRFELHGEGLYQWTGKRRDDAFWAFVVGTTCTLDGFDGAVWPDRLVWTVDYGREFIVSRQRRTDYLLSSEIVRIGQHDFLARLAGEFGADWSVELVGQVNLDDDGVFVAPGVRHRPHPGLWLALRADFFAGQGSSFYGRWERNQRLVGIIEYRF